MALNKVFCLLFALIFSISSVKGASDSIEIVVFFKEKSCLNIHEDVSPVPLSLKAQERRQFQNIAIDETDFPVCPSEIESLSHLGVKIFSTSRWLNAAYVKLPNSNALLSQIENLPGVRNWILQSRGLKTKAAFTAGELLSNEAIAKPYGFSFLMNDQINLQKLHYQGFEGKGMNVAVIDAGFSGVDTIDFFQHLFSNRQLKGVWNFVDENENVFSSSNHGTEVLSVLAANLENLYRGTAVSANYYLLKSEQIGKESPFEEFNLVRALEYADSVGVDVANISVGYSDFDDTLFNYRWTDLDGKKSLASQAVDMAVSKGMLVVTSAGNEGTVQWKYITVPADADKVIAVGAVKEDRSIAGFSSRGLENDARVKPNLAALGHRIPVVNDKGQVVETFGTSFASPVIAGAATCLWQMFPKANVAQITKALEQSADRYNEPDNKYGYGIPDLNKAAIILNYELQRESVSQPELIRTDSGFCLYSPEKSAKSAIIFMNSKNKIVFKKPLESISAGYTCWDFNEFKQFNSSIYKIIVSVNQQQLELMIDN